MAGKHRKTSRPAIVVAMVVAPAGLAAAAMAATTMTTGVTADTTVAAKPPQSVDLLALITPANSTAQIFAGTTYYGTNYANTSYAPQQVVPFLAGPQGIATAISEADGDPDGTVVLASGWGAGQTGTALGIVAANNPEDLSDVDLVILDNNTNRAGGGFWTTYYPFAPLLLTSAEPTPTDLPKGVTVLDAGYEYNINGNAAVDPLNPFTLGNSLAAYAYGYGQESTALNITQKNGKVVLHDVDDGDVDDVPDDDVTLVPGNHYVIKDDKVVVYEAKGTAENPNNSTIYVTVDSGELPLTRPLRLLPGGDILADAIDPTMTALVDAGYADGKGTADDPAIPKDPTVTRPMQPGSSLGALGGVPGTVPIGLAKGATTAQDDISNPTNLVTKPVDELGNLPVISGGAGLPSLPGLSTTGGNLFTPGNNKKPAGSTPGGANPVKNFTDRINDAVNKVTGGLTGAKPASSDSED